MQVAGYVRVSTDEQGDSGAGLDAQRAAIKTACAARGWTLVAIEQDIASGKSMRKRPGLERALAACKRGEVAAVVASKLDRLSRSVGDFDKLLRDSRREGYDVVTLQPDIDTSSAYGKAMAQMVSVFAELERELIGERTRDALAARRAAGVRLGRPRTLPEKVRRRIVRERQRGDTFRAIAERLNADGVPTAQGGARWHPNTVRKVVLSDAA